MTAKSKPWTDDDTIIRGRKSLVERLYLAQNPVRAAALDLLAACQAARNLGTLAETYTPCEARAMLDAAIAKAEGK